MTMNLFQNLIKRCLVPTAAIRSGLGRSLLATVLLTSNTAAVAQLPACATTWPAWQKFKQNFVSGDGRVIDHSSPNKQTVSEGQAYAMMFALIAGDRDSFRQLLTWTANNLAGGDLTVSLPAWQWGHKQDQSWGVIDNNSASDADLWIAYALMMAGAEWREPRYQALGKLMAARILKEETTQLNGLGLTLLPAPKGFQNPDLSWKLNPSYAPLQVLRWFAASEQDPRWNELLDSTQKVILAAAPAGYVADWILYHPQSRSFSPDLQGAERGQGGYNAIRVYLWSAMLHPADPARPVLLKQFNPMAELVAKLGYPPEYINIQNGIWRGAGGIGFSSALLPFLQSINSPAGNLAARQQALRLNAQGVDSNHYYDQVLHLFSSGWREGRYQFAANGALKIKQLTSRCSEN